MRMRLNQLLMTLVVLLIATGSFQCTSEQARRAEQMAILKKKWESRPIRPGQSKVRDFFWKDLVDSTIAIQIGEEGFAMPSSWMRVYLLCDTQPGSVIADARRSFRYALTYEADTIRTLDDSVRFCFCDSTLARVFQEHKARCIDRTFKFASYDSFYVPFRKRYIKPLESMVTQYKIIFSDTSLTDAVESLKHIPGAHRVYRIVEVKDIMPVYQEGQ
jgi:hypothetical protein